ncbi:hypothetical protein NC797_05920 [Aquibacillus sp. 3ASR75-11]|uniref:Uncharacterized protein n=1 Tax=Terrihalobacillus insolitus TaxID=2950438 RepID=A0A9X4AN09_9BACI|nr:hypothetical protein [Terrihalobacillus insolitus]MDC3415123.1 hypothetical protein [Terrihalobacillus insolitus]MDC3424045.1 hypothetical protein [Terrihalobacillus insolitus]
MEIYGLYGKSGTGKSHKAMQVLKDYEADAIIDDGLLIINKRKVAGKSAKNENSFIAATKRATFFSDRQRNEVYQYLQKSDIRSILIIGTSRKMIRKIVERLDLQPDISWIPIEKYQSNRELRIARARRAKNYHVIPVFPLKIDSTFYGKWFRRLVIKLGKRNESILLVKPIYFQKNKIIISPQCVKDIVQFNAISAIKLHKVQVDFEKVQLVISVKKALSIYDVIQWRDALISDLYCMLKTQYTVDIKWKSIALNEHNLSSNIESHP